MQRRQFLKNRKVGRDIIGNKIYYITSDDNLIEINDGCVNSDANITLKTRDGDKKVTVFDKPITELNDTFTDLANVTAVSIPESVKYIGGKAFIGAKLECVNIDNIGNWCNVSFGSYSHPTYNDEYRFILYSNWEPVTDLIIPAGVTSINIDTFLNCNNLTSVTIPDSVTSIGSRAFQDCKNLANIIISEDSQLKSTGHDSFFNTQWYNNLTDGVVYIGKVLYKYKGSMSSNTIIEVKKNTISIGNGAFQDCTGLTSITIPDSVVSIGAYAFGGCTGLTSITIPDSVVSIGVHTFEDCAGLTSINIPDGVTSIGSSAFRNCDNLTSITIPNSVTNIDNWTFYGCNRLTSITIPNSVVSIGTEAFRNCDKLTSVTNPASVTNIGDWAFYGCTGLTSITCNALIPPSIKTYTFHSGMSRPVYVPDESVEYYKQDSYWGLMQILPIQNTSTPDPSTPDPSTPDPSTPDPSTETTTPAP